jgi:hypothetical protein
MSVVAASRAGYFNPRPSESTRSEVFGSRDISASLEKNLIFIACFMV